MQSFTKSSDNDDVVYTHWSGTTHRLPWQDVLQIVECTVQEAEQLEELVKSIRKLAAQAGVRKPPEDEESDD